MRSEKTNLLYNLPREIIFFHSLQNRLHSLNVAVLSAALAKSIGYSHNQVARVYLGALLHDVGKQFVPDKLLNKPKKLTKTEFDQIQCHTWKGYLYLHQFISDNIILKTTLHHHEHWNGSGYPCCLKQEKIPLEARICTVADVWDALVSKRCYHDALNISQALDFIWKGAGNLFDPELASAFISLVEDSQRVTLSGNLEMLMGFIYRNTASKEIKEIQISSENYIGFRNTMMKDTANILPMINQLSYQNYKSKEEKFIFASRVPDPCRDWHDGLLGMYLSQTYITTDVSCLPIIS